MTKALEISDLRKNYPDPDAGAPVRGTLPILEIPFFEIDEAAAVALRGESGCGKTTLLHLIAGILAPDSGRIIVAGREMTGMSEPELDSVRATSIGCIFQSFHLIQGLSALENVALGMAFGDGIDWDRSRELLRRVGLSHRADHLPRALSVGQQQRVAVARALAGRPVLVLADEPTGNLDAGHAQEAMDLVREICLENKSALMVVTHDARVLSHFERVVDLSTINRAGMSSPMAGAAT